MSLLKRIGRPVPPIDIMVLQDASKLREWWHNIIRTHGKFDLYGLFLILPSDTSVISYLRKQSAELNQISGEKCLIMAMTDITTADDLGEFNMSEWATAIDDYVKKRLLTQS